MFRKILLVEDNPADARLAIHILKSGPIDCEVDVVHDGQEALEYLFKNKMENHPDLIILDLNLPKVDGREVLREIKNHPLLRRTPVLVLSTSDAESDVSYCYDLHANCYYKKPMQLDDLISILRSVQEDWLTLARLPEEHERTGS